VALNFRFGDPGGCQSNLSFPDSRLVEAQPGGKVLITDGPYLETKEHIGGFWVLEATDMKEALEWGRKAVVACRAPGRGATVSLTLIQRSAMETVQIAAIVVRTEKNFRFMSIRFSAVRQYCCYSKTPTEENGHALHQHFNVQSN
jgi:hypothetical protein